MKVYNLKTDYKINPLGLHEVPRLSWQLASADKSVLQTAYQVQVAASAEGLKQSRFIWDSTKVHSDQSVHVDYEGPSLQSGQRLYWQVTVWDNFDNVAISDETAFWEMGLLSATDWKATWITNPGRNPELSEPCPYFRKGFFVDKKVISARIYATALGLYELELNGKKVGDEVFAPGWTNYHKRLQYQVYDVTNHLTSGSNALGAILGDGWYSGHFGWWENNRNNYGEHPALLLQLEVQYADGSSETINSDASWKCTTGPILKSDIYNGETYDASKEMPGWSMGGFKDDDWEEVELLDKPDARLVASDGDKIKKVQELYPKEVFTTPAGEQVLDLGQNMVGWVRLKVQGKQGEEVTLKYAEVLDQEGNFYTANLRKIDCTDRYILKGEGVELYEPKFTFHGFRYVKVEGYPGELTKESVTGIVVHSDMDCTGSFVCSDPLINQLQSNIQWGQKGNFLDVPTDCPQRDERLGWTGDAQVFAPTASFNFNTAPFFTKWLKDLESEQRADGSVPWVVPNIIKDGGGTGWSDGFGATGWADAAVIIPWVLYQVYGDKRILSQQYQSMKSWVEYMKEHAGEECIFEYGFHFGDWLSFSDYFTYNYNAPDYGYAGAHTDKALIATAYFYYSTNILKKTATVLGKDEDVREVEKLLPRIKKAWNSEFVTRTGRLVSATQTAYAIALHFDVIDEDKKGTIGRRLAEDVQYFGHLTTGFLGTPLLTFALSDHGYTDVAYQLLMNKRYPSWLYPVTRGATTIWERWDGIRPDGTFQTTGMNSFNHYAYGAVGEWLYSRVAGIQIDPEQPGYKHIILNPSPGGGLTEVSATLETLYGKISSSWTVKGNKVTYTVEVPANATATVILHTAEDKVLLDGAPLDESENNNAKDHTTSFELGSGKYRIEYLLNT